MKKFALPLCMLLIAQGCVSLGQTSGTTGPELAPLYQTVPIFENTLPQCRLDVIEPIEVHEPLDSPKVVEQVTARAMFLGGDALVRLPTLSPMEEGSLGQARRCSLAVIKFRKWTCKH